MATSKIPVWAKGYVTTRRLVIIGVVFFAMLLVFGGWSIRELKKAHRDNQSQDALLKELSEQQKKMIEQNRVRDSIYEIDYKKNNEQRERQRQVTNKNRDDNIKKIYSPGFNDDSIRRGFTGY